MQTLLFHSVEKSAGRNSIAIFVAGLLCCAVVTAAENSSPASLEILDSPAPANSSLSRIVSDEAGRVYLSWVSQEGELARFAFSQLTDDGWSEPVLISEGSDWFVNWADFPMLSVNSGNMATHWLRMSATGTYDYDIEASFYDVRSNRWSDSRVIHSDGVSAEHGFVSMLPMGDSHTLITWLDGRNTRVGEEYGEMTLRAGVFSSTGENMDEWELDSRVCDCCQTSSAMTTEGPMVVYRDRSENEIRDIFVVRYTDGKWSTPTPVHNDNWQISGCPVNGPSISAKGEKVAVAWFTAKDDTPKVQLALSSDSGDSFSAPIIVAGSETNGRVGTAMLDSGDIVVSWIDTANRNAVIMLSHFSAEGKFLESIEIAQTSASRRSGFPIIESVANTVYVSWTDINDTPQVKVARLLLD